VADPHFTKGGCLVTMPTSPGARIRYQLDRESAAFKTLYNQRSATERINPQGAFGSSQALELGIERPKLRRGSAIANQNTLIYVLINPSTSLRAGSARLATRAGPQSRVDRPGGDGRTAALSLYHANVPRAGRPRPAQPSTGGRG
jgi:hypothetical protein